MSIVYVLESVELAVMLSRRTQVAVSRTQPGGRVIGIDIIPAQPPRGVSTIQGNFLDPAVREYVRAYVQDPARGRPRRPVIMASSDTEDGDADAISLEDLENAEKSYIDLERQTNVNDHSSSTTPPRELDGELIETRISAREKDGRADRVVDVVLSDMSAPWELASGMWVKSISNPYRRMMNTSGTAFRDHAGSMVSIVHVIKDIHDTDKSKDLCLAALSFGFDALRTGGHFVCKFYQGAEERSLEKRLKTLFEKVHREKPTASRDVSSP